MNSIIKLTNVSKEYGSGLLALNDISLQINEGEFVYVIGESGAGKSTFLKLLYREEQCTSGTVEVLNKNLMNIKDTKIHTLRREIGCVFQDFKLLPNLTVYENIAFVLQVTNVPKDEIESKVMDALKRMKLESKRDNFPDELSGGQQQRIAIARAIVNNPQLLICDEPTGNLDPATGEEIFKEILEINNSGTTVVMTTHNKDLVNKYQKRVIQLVNGSIVLDEENGTFNENLMVEDSLI